MQHALPAVPAGLIEQLRAVVGETGVLTGEEVAARYPGYFMDRIAADAIVRPRTTEEVSAVLQLCNAAGQPVVVQGGMSGWVRATQTKAGEIALSLERMAAIEEIDTVNRTATVQAGVILDTLETALAEHGLTFPLDLGGRGSCQLGGNASTNAGGMRVIRYGMMREQVLGVEAVLADGRVISSLNQMIKNNTGYDLKQLFIGSEGTLGVITRLVLRLRERPTSSNTAIVCASDFSQIVYLLRFVDQGLGGLLSAFELIDNNFYNVNTGAGKHAAPLASDKPYYAIIEMLGSQQERDSELFETVLGEAGERGYFDDAVLARSETQREQIWNIREDLEHVVREFQPFYAFDVSLPVGRMQDYIAAVTEKLKGRWPDSKIAFLGHMGDGNLHIAIGAGGEDDRHGVEACVYEPLRPIGGSISAEHGIGLEKKPWLDVTRSADERKLMKDIKQLLDPGNILNPGKILDLHP
ncbi:FAD-binding oxidoreductase [Sphingopyxis sp. LC363]|jgi:FAD/FMN-containing dehydrogenase|uniref:FAD-binding oxidoreductase n=1 Tax=Sphingopyxis sp. LC363 TaxID=1120705 RepID=UPI00050E27C9|nr:FAD-binding oxidoreductase [Sphingopyxis sp. LC363]KGB59045.1 putative oxidoreductase [Sphingopyxis sp. LC363]